MRVKTNTGGLKEFVYTKEENRTLSPEDKEKIEKAYIQGLKTQQQEKDKRISMEEKTKFFMV